MRPIAEVNDAFRAIADPTRRQVLDLLLEHEQSVTDLGGRFRMTQPAISQHLRVLREAGLVKYRRAGRARIYSACPAKLRSVAGWVAQYERFWKRKLGALGTHLEKKQ